ncbi:MAG: LAGLIDADG family homing endonuclease [Candidatus Bipolaricaulia bacterium]
MSQGVKVKESLLEELSQRAMSGEELKSLCKEAGICFETLRKYMRKNGLRVYTKLTPELERKVEDLWNEGLYVHKIASIVGYERTKVSKVLRKKGYTIDTCAVRHNVFRDLEDPETQYWLGQMASDGCVYMGKGQNKVILTSCEDNDPILKSFCNFVGLSETKIRRDYNQKSSLRPKASVDFHSRATAEGLVQLGITPRKSHTLKVNFTFTGDFIRGVLDGDGCVSIRDGGRVQVKFFSASKNFADQIRDWLLGFGIDARLNTRKRHSSQIFTVKVGKKDDLVLLHRLLYPGGCSTFLQRKKDKFDLLFMT